MESKAQSWLSLPRSERQKLLNRLIAKQDKADYIDLVSAGNMGVFASLGVHFDFAIFGRDSIQVAEDLLETHQALSKRIILVLASLQGVKYDDKSEQEPGKIHHEYRTKIFNDIPIPEYSLNIMKRLQQSWGDENRDDLCYYGTFDATPLYVRLVGRYIDMYGKDFLEEKYNGLDGEKTIKDSLRAAISWLIGKIETSSWMLLEFKRLNWDAGIANQVWKDSGTSYLHTNGEMANHDNGIASVELQAYAYDALKTAANLISFNEQEKHDWLELAKQIQKQTIDKLWMTEKRFFAQGLDRGPDNQTRKIETLTSNPGLLLDSNLLLDLPATEAASYVEGVVQMLLGVEFMTDAGIRCRALVHSSMPGFVDYHGSYTVWPRETYALARGLRRFNKLAEASQLESKILHSVMKAGEFYEFFYVNEKGSAWYDRDDAIKYFEQNGMANNIATPESGQAWTISAVQAILSNI